MGIFNPHPGSVSIGGFRLPDFGISEAAGRFLNKPVTKQGGSNIFGKDKAAEPLPPLPPLQPPTGKPTTTFGQLKPLAPRITPPTVPLAQPPPQREEPRREEPPQQQRESDFDAQIRLAREKQEEAERVANERIRRRGEVIAPIERDVESYLGAPPPSAGGEPRSYAGRPASTGRGRTARLRAGGGGGTPP